ncbi:Uncharacterised protein [Oligella urethralis]|uniref:hypothetical protein n=1 Tax=Oligella urethralis TaxID=90245 RepID=UPI000DFEC16B|nr:hypothetical protein [Oligella urethralis]SUA63194.1 Uncharacterised protein [Oligella urethralis]
MTTTTHTELINRARQVNDTIITPAMKYLPPKMDSKKARAMMIAIALQESRMIHTRQIRGPARGYWQFESGGGLRGIMNHRASAPYLRGIVQSFNLPWERSALFNAIEHMQVFAAICARLLLWTDPRPLPASDAEQAWQYYMRVWRPGKPHRHTWDNFWKIALEVTKDMA